MLHITNVSNALEHRQHQEILLHKRFRLDPNFDCNHIRSYDDRIHCDPSFHSRRISAWHFPQEAKDLRKIFRILPRNKINSIWNFHSSDLHDPESACLGSLHLPCWLPLLPDDDDNHVSSIPDVLPSCCESIRAKKFQQYWSLKWFDFSCSALLIPGNFHRLVAWRGCSRRCDHFGNCGRSSDFSRKDLQIIVN